MPHARGLVLSLLAVAVAVLAGFAFWPGGGSNPDRGAALAAARSGVETGRLPPSYVVKSSDPISATTQAPSPARYPTGLDNDEVSATGAEAVEPCRLFSQRRAAAILGGPVRVSEEHQGPTCVFALRGSNRQVTLVVEDVQMASLRQHARRASRIGVAGRAGWCLRYESTSVAVPLAAGHVLHVTGPCPVAARLAALASPALRSRLPGR